MRTSKPARILLPSLTIATLFITPMTSTAATAVVEPMCNGKAATITQADASSTVQGTDGDDVIVATDALVVRALDGDDSVCLRYTILTSEVAVFAGDGDDFVDATQSGGVITYAYLESGSDQFIGSPFNDHVDDGDRTGAGADAIATREGRDRVQVGGAGTPATDLVDLGADRDRLKLTGLPAGTSRFAAGPDGAELVLYAERAWQVNAAKGTVGGASSGTSASIVGFTEYKTEVASSVRFQGSNGRDELTLRETLTALQGTTRYSASMGGGNDRVKIQSPLSDGTLNGGRGRDELVIDDRKIGKVEIELNKSRYSTTSRGAVTHSRVTGLEDAMTINVRKVTMTGDAAANRLTSRGACKAVLRGGAGRDQLRFTGNCTTVRRALGQAGNDRLYGSIGRDYLAGGAGRDFADGKAERDTCIAELRRRCEAG